MGNAQSIASTEVLPGVVDRDNSSGSVENYGASRQRLELLKCYGSAFHEGLYRTAIVALGYCFFLFRCEIGSLDIDTNQRTSG